MATRCNIIIQDSYTKIYIYRHWDGYPSCTGEDLKGFVKGYTDNTYRLDAMQSAGWLIVHGYKRRDDKDYAWKVGDYEPTTEIHGDSEYLYTIDLSDRTLTCFELSNNGKRATLCKEFPLHKF